jgi:tetratricopeptide (TPR) repeat protein
MPDHADCHHRMGLLAHQTGRGRLALDHLRRATVLKPAVAEYHNNLGGVLRDLGRPSDAVAAYRNALRLSPAVPEIHRNLGCALADMGQLKRAESSFRDALRLNPTYIDALNDLGNLLLGLGRGRADEARACFETAIGLSPADPVLHNNLALALRLLGRLDEAIAHLEEAVRLRPGYANGWTNLGNLLREKGQFTAARECLERAISLAPDSVDARINLGAARYGQGQFDEAAEIFRAGLAIAPDSADLTWNLALALLARGDYEAGWRAFEARWRTRQSDAVWHDSPAPTWNATDGLEGKTILLFAEQGLGDTLQFVRYAPLLATRGVRVLLLVQPALASLVARANGIAAAFGFGQKLPKYDLQYPLMSLPTAMAAWRSRLGALRGRKIGIVWASGPRPNRPELNRRSIRFEQFAPLADIGGVSFISLQKGDAAREAGAPIAGLDLHDWTGELDSFADTAALVENLDLVISVDTSVAHLAGALGRPIWLLNRFEPCWRWLRNRDDSPWYHSLRQFRQTEPGDWTGVILRVRAALRDWVEQPAMQGQRQ